MKPVLRHTLDGVLGLAASALLLVAIEGALRWRSPRVGPAPVSLSRGFDESAAYIVPDPEVPGGFLSQFSDGRFPEKQFAPASERRRVILVGGSNTAGFGVVYLQAALDERAGEGVWEVCNLGRSGYGSERVRIVTEQALRLLDPDVVVVYSGHNEFVERSFRIDLDRAWEGELETRVGDLAQRSRLIGTISEWLRPDEWRDPNGAKDFEDPLAAVPESHKDEYKKFLGLEWERTLEYYEAYRHNLISIARSCAERDVDVLLCSVVYNRFAAPFQSTLDPTLSQEIRDQHESLRKRIVALLPQPLKHLSPEHGWEHLFHYDWVSGQGHRAPSDMPGLRRMLGRLEKERSILPEPKKKALRHYRSLEFLFTPQLRTPEEKAVLEEALVLLTEAIALVPDHPRSLFEYGLVLLALDRERERAARALELAGALDRAPRRASALSNRLCEDAAAVSGAPFYDADGLFSQSAPDGLVGFEFMVDQCHLSLGGVFVLMDELAEELTSE